MLEVGSIHVKVVNDNQVETLSMEEPVADKLSVEAVKSLLHRLNMPVEGDPMPVVYADFSIWLLKDVKGFIGGAKGRYCEITLICGEGGSE